MTRPRTLLITPGWQGVDGVSAATRNYIEALAGAVDLEVWSLAAATSAGPRPPDGVRAFFAGGKGRLALAALVRAARPPELVLSMHVNVAPVALPMALRGAALVVVLHGVEAWRPLRLRERLALRRARALIAVSAHTAGRFQAANSALAAQPIAVCHHCLPELLTTAAPTAAAPPAPPYALIVARMAAEERYKGHDLLLEIWPEVRSQVPTARLLIAGGGDDRPRLEAKRDALGLQPAVEFLGRVPDEDLRALYQNCAFFVMPSRHEGFGLVFLEAMRARKACIGAMGSASEIIEHEKTGFVFDADDRTGIRDACVRLFSDPEFAARMGDAGRRREAEVFSFAAFRAQLLELLRLPG